MTASSQHPAAPGSQTVIVLGVDTPIGVAILRDLGRHGYRCVGIGRSDSCIGFASHHCHESQVRAASEDALIEQLLALGERYPKAPLIAISEHDHLLLNRHRAALEQCLQVMGARQEQLDIVLDKARCNALAAQAGIRVPHSFEPTSMQDIQSQAPQLSYPRVLKWADPNRVVKPLQALGLEVHKYQYARDAQELIRLLAPYEALGEYPLVQEYCPGGGLGQMFLVRNGDIILEFQHERLHEWPPEGGVSSLCRSVPLTQHRVCRQRSAELLRALNWNGVAMVEYRYDQTNGEYYFMEVNGRFWGSLPLATAAGLPFASGLVQSATGSDRPPQPAYPVLLCRFMIPETRRLLRMVLQRSQIQDPWFHYSALRELLKYPLYFLHPAMRYYIFEWRDPGPFLADCKNILAKLAFWK